MTEKFTTSFTQSIKEYFQSNWKLLTETERFIAATPLSRSYEQVFYTWRTQLHTSRSPDDHARVRQEIVALRKSLRLQGYDLSLGSITLVVKNFVNDDAAARGYCRVVLCFCDTGLYWYSGQANHLELAGILQQELERKNVYHHPEMHYLWFLWQRNALVLSGSATETAENFERLQKRAHANPQKILRFLKNLA